MFLQLPEHAPGKYGRNDERDHGDKHHGGIHGRCLSRETLTLAPPTSNEDTQSQPSRMFPMMLPESEAFTTST